MGLLIRSGWGDCSMKKIITLITVALTGCATPETFSKMSNQELCMGYLTKPDYNIYQKDRANELAKRGEDCKNYIEQAKVRNTANAIAKPAPDAIQNNNSMTCIKAGSLLQCN